MVERGEHSSAIAGHRGGETSAVPEDVVGQDRLRIRRSQQGRLADELGMEREQGDVRQLEELMERDEDRQLGGGEQLVRRGRRGRRRR